MITYEVQRERHASWGSSGSLPKASLHNARHSGHKGLLAWSLCHRESVRCNGEGYQWLPTRCIRSVTLLRVTANLSPRHLFAVLAIGIIWDPTLVSYHTVNALSEEWDGT